MDYAIFYRRSVAPDRLRQDLPAVDVFVSAFNSSDRVNAVFNKIVAHDKIWLVHPEYQYSDIELPRSGRLVRPASRDESIQIDDLVAACGPLSGRSLCVDITGFMRHALVFLLPKLQAEGVAAFTALYSEPITYIEQERTTFSTTTSGVVRPVRGMYGSPRRGADHLLISVGYDHKLISEVSANKDGVIVHPMFGFPSLSADMYQQSAIRTEKSGEVARSQDWVANRLFAPANDPFSTAQVISERVSMIAAKDPEFNMYLAPLATKAQALGMSFYWLHEGRACGGSSLLLPECLTYSRETTTGLRRLWEFCVELY